jgi:hypothetical protein
LDALAHHPQFTLSLQQQEQTATSLHQEQQALLKEIVKITHSPLELLLVILVPLVV